MLPSKITKYFYKDYISNEININDWWVRVWLGNEQETTNFPPVECLDVVRLGATILLNPFGGKSYKFLIVESDQNYEYLNCISAINLTDVIYSCDFS
jgi:hypothetical protein